MLPSVVALSLWMNDADRHLERRVRHLLDKTYPSLRFVWGIGDETDDTEAQLRRLTKGDSRVSLYRTDTGIVGQDSATRLRRMSRNFNAILDEITTADDFVLLHESDLISPPDVVERLLGMSGDVNAGWPMLGDIFYDTFAYRKDGVMFNNRPPYHSCYRKDAPFEVDSVGSCWMAPAVLFSGVDGIRCHEYGVIEVMRGLKAKGLTVMVDPTLIIEQPVDLWTSFAHVAV